LDPSGTFSGPNTAAAFATVADIGHIVTLARLPTMPRTSEIKLERRRGQMVNSGFGPSVSVIMPTFNPGSSLERSIRSVVEQSCASWELIVVDDASTEKLDEILRSYTSADKRIRSIRLDRNGGPAVARNAGLALSSGDWIALLDDDDVWLPTRMERLLTEASSHSAQIVYDNILGYDDFTKEITGPIFSKIPDHLTLFDVLAPEYEGLHNLGYIKPIVSRQFLTRNALKYDESLRGGEDLILLLDVLAQGAKTRGVNEALYVYTTQVGHKSGRRSMKTRSLPRDRSIGEALLRLCKRNESLLSISEKAALEERAAAFFESVPLGEFRHAKLTGRWSEVLRLLFRHASVRRYAQLKIKERARKALSMS
jgi:succinoglycan biosynthesis protein ExoO